MRLARVAEQKFDLGRPEIARIDPHQLLSVRASIPASSTPPPRQTISRPMQAKARSTNSRTLWVSPVAST